MSKTYNAGIVTAYGAAVRGGYTGTYEQFKAAMARFSVDATEVVEAAQNIGEYMERAEAAATGAAASEAAAAISEDNAAGAANDAAASQRAAAQSATNAATSAAAAANVEQVVIAASEAAQAAEENVQANADRASEAAEAAEASELAAAGSATAAWSSKTAAASSETAAAGSATAAAGSATAAAASETAAAASATAAAASEAAAAASEAHVDEVAETIPEDFTELEAHVQALDAFARHCSTPVSLTGQVLDIEDGAPLPVDALTVQIGISQSGSGDPAPDNVRPIAGWTGARVIRAGKNLFDKTQVLAGYWLSNTTLLPESNTNYCVSDYIPIRAGQAIYVGEKGTARNVLYDKYLQPTTYRAGQNGTIVPEADGFIRFAVGNSYIDTFQVEIGTAATAYSASEAQTISVTFPTGAGTVYGGVLDVAAGTLTVTHAGFTATAAVAADSTGKVFSIGSKADAVVSTGAAAITSDRLKTYSLGGLRGDGVTDGIAQNQTTFYVKRAGCTTVAETSAWLAENPVTVVYPLATPVVYTVDPVSLTLLEGNNTVWADAGALSMTYRADIYTRLEAEINELRAMVLENINA